uniref:Uncharacterized protein n=1 Tax=Hucho hucho TaxID=62062 RepID=A0A4W5QB04_9TELE
GPEERCWIPVADVLDPAAGFPPIPLLLALRVFDALCVLSFVLLMPLKCQARRQARRPSTLLHLISTPVAHTVTLG